MISNAQSVSNRTALQFSVHPFSSQNEARFANRAVYKFADTYTHIDTYDKLLTQCNEPDLFSDSALIITDARYSYGQWRDSFSRTNRKAWSELNKCALSKAQDAPDKYEGLPANCANYLRERQPENALTNVELRKECPMIPDFGKANGISADLPVQIAKAFAGTIRYVTL